MTFAVGAPREAKLSGGISVEGRRLVDDLGREVLLRGVNLGRKSAPFLPPHTDDDIRRLVDATGANLARVYVAWRALEEAPGDFRSGYADDIRRHAERLARHGLHVLIDLHQDVWGGRFATHGAPPWATLGSGSAESIGGSWLLDYVKPGVYRSFQALWENHRVPETGLGLQDHMARAWAHLASRLASLDGLLGYDLLNEPFCGREITPGLLRLGAGNLPLLAAVMRKAVRRGDDRMERVVAELRKRLAGRGRLDRLVRSAGFLNHALEPRLLRFALRVGTAIREVDPRGVIGIEPPALASIGVPTTWSENDARALDGIRPCAYLPHLYDVVLELGGTYDHRIDRVRTALRRHVRAAEILELPLLAGEWGFLRRSVGDVGAFARDARGELDAALASAAYWEHEPGFTAPRSGEAPPEADRLGCLEALPPFPQRIAGRLTRVSWDAGSNTLTFACDVDREFDAPSVVAFPERFRGTAGVEVTVTPAAGARVEVPAGSGLVLVHTDASSPRRLVVVRPARRGHRA